MKKLLEITARRCRRYSQVKVKSRGRILAGHSVRKTVWRRDCANHLESFLQYQLQLRLSRFEIGYVKHITFTYTMYNMCVCMTVYFVHVRNLFCQFIYTTIRLVYYPFSVCVWFVYCYPEYFWNLSNLLLHPPVSCVRLACAWDSCWDLLNAFEMNFKTINTTKLLCSAILQTTMYMYSSVFWLLQRGEMFEAAGTRILTHNCCAQFARSKSNDVIPITYHVQTHANTWISYNVADCRNCSMRKVMIIANDADKAERGGPWLVGTPGDVSHAGSCFLPDHQRCSLAAGRYVMTVWLSGHWFDVVQRRRYRRSTRRSWTRAI